MTLPTRSQLPGRPRLAVIVPATDSPATLEPCLAALEAAIAIDDELIVERLPRETGPAAARNAGAARASAEVLVFVDADVVVAPDALERLRAAFVREPGLSALFGSYDDAPAAPGAVSRFRNLLHHHVHASATGPAETFWAGLGAVRRAHFFAAGGFDEQRFPEPAIEDIELGRRMRRLGMEIRLDPQIRGTHLKRWSLAAMLRTDATKRALPWTRLQLEERELGGSLNLSARHRAGALAALALAAALLARRPAPAAASLLAFTAVDLPLLRLLERRGGPGLAAAGIPLHLLHHLAAVGGALAALPAHAAAGFPRDAAAAPAGTVQPEAPAAQEVPV